MATQTRSAERPAPTQARPAGAFRPVALPALAAAMQAVRSGRPTAPRRDR